MDSRERVTPVTPPTFSLDPAGGWAGERTRVAVGANTNVAGKLIFQEPVRIEGTFKGDVSSSDLVVIAPGAKIIDGRVRAARLLVLGQLTGDSVDAERVVIGPQATVNADIHTAYLTIHDGARFNGRILMQQPRSDYLTAAHKTAHDHAG
jgi:cytoskeletal protein CcmA (bactofilin family)